LTLNKHVSSLSRGRLSISTPVHSVTLGLPCRSLWPQLWADLWCNPDWTTPTPLCMECQHAQTTVCQEFSYSYGSASLRHLSASERLSYLHWLPVHYRIQFKIATLTYKTLATCQPSYLCNLLQLDQPSRALRSSTQQLLQVPYMSTDFGRRAFSYCSPATWNSIRTSIKNCSSLKRHVKSHLILSYI